MSSQAPIEVEEELATSFQNAVEGNSTRLLQVQVKDEKLVKISSVDGSSNLENDFKEIANQASDDKASYFLFKLKPKEWLFVTYVPDGVAVKDKMIYASAKGALKDRLGHTYLEEELHATNKDELSYEHYNGSKTGDARSEFEKEHAKMLEEENETRKEIVKEMEKKEAQGATGGYHSVSIPLAASAKTALDRLKSSDVNFVSLSVSDDKASIISDSSKQVSVNQLVSELHPTEPRFYLYSQPGKSIVFIYCCPEKSPPKLRMVYSTSKPNVVSQVTQYGVNLASKRVEITDTADVTDELKDAQIAPIRPSALKANSGRGFTGRMISPASGNTPDLGGTVKASNLPTIGGNQQHSIYGLMAKPGTETSSTKKKIVIPPRAAWNG